MDSSFVDLALARRLELAHAWRAIHYARAYAELHPDSRPEVEPIAGSLAVFVAPHLPLNRVSGLGLSGVVLDADLELLEIFFRVRGVPTRVEICPLAHPSLFEVLQRRGYRLERFFSVLYLPLPAAPHRFADPLPDTGELTMPLDTPEGLYATAPGYPGSAAQPRAAVRSSAHHSGNSLAIRPTTAADGELWLTTVAQGFDESDFPSPATLDILGPNFYAANAATFLATVAGEPAGGGGFYAHEGVAEFGGASTRSSFRRRGVQTTLLNTRLQAAFEQGCDLAFTLTTPGSASQRNIQRAGFRLAYTQVVMVK